MFVSASAFAGTYFFPLASFLSIWHDIPLSLPLPRCRWQTAYCVLLISVRYFTMILIVKSRPMCHKQLGVERTSLPYGFLTAGREAGGGENALINYGILQTLFSRTASCPIHPIIISVLHPPIPTQVRQSMSASRGYGQSSVEVSSEGCPPSEGSPQCPTSGTLFIGCHIFQYRTDRYGPADISKHGSLLLPLLRCTKVWHQYHIPMRQYTNGLFVETAVLFLQSPATSRPA